MKEDPMKLKNDTARRDQGPTRGPATYARLKDIITPVIPSLNPEPALSEALPQTAVFDHLVDDGLGGATLVETLVTFLHEH